MAVAVAVVAHVGALRSLLCVRERHALLSCAEHEQLDRAERLAHVAAHRLRDVRRHAVLDRDLPVPDGEGKRPLDRPLHVPRLDGLELKHRAAAQDRVVDVKIGVLGRGGDQRHLAGLDEFQQALLLLFVEILDLVQIHERAVRRKEGVQLVDDRLDIRDARGGGVEVVQLAVGLLCDDGRDRGLAHAGRAVKNQVRDVAALDHAAQQAVFAQQVLLADHVIQRFRADLVR